MKKRALLLAILFAIARTAYPQMYQWPLFPMNCMSPGSPSSIFNMPTGTSPTGFPPRDASSNSVHEATNSCYDEHGTFLFSVEGQATAMTGATTFPAGIYDAKGNLVYAFIPDIGYYGTSTTSAFGTSSYSSYYPSWWSVASPTGTLSPLAGEEQAVSEIEIFPNQGRCHSYYVMFWSQDDIGAGVTANDLRLIEVVTNFPNVSIVNDYVLLRVNSGTSQRQWTGIVADRMRNDGSRDVYALYQDQVVTGSGSISSEVNITKWTFDAGGLNSPAFSTSSAGYYVNTPTHNDLTPLETFTDISPCNKVVKLSTAGDIGFVIFNSMLTSVDNVLFTTNIYCSSIPTPYHAYNSPGIAIHGFEYATLPSGASNWYVSYSDNIHGGGGVGYFPAVSTCTSTTSSTPFTSITGAVSCPTGITGASGGGGCSMLDFKHTDLTYAGGNYIMLVGDPSLASGVTTPTVNPYIYPAPTYYFPTGYLASIDLTHPTNPPVYSTVTTGSDLSAVPIDMEEDAFSYPFLGEYYLGNEIHNERYNYYYATGSITHPGAVTINGLPLTPFPMSYTYPAPGANPVCPDDVNVTLPYGLTPSEYVTVTWSDLDPYGSGTIGGYEGLGGTFTPYSYNMNITPTSPLWGGGTHWGDMSVWNHQIWIQVEVGHACITPGYRSWWESHGIANMLADNPPPANYAVITGGDVSTCATGCSGTTSVNVDLSSCTSMPTFCGDDPAVTFDIPGILSLSPYLPPYPPGQTSYALKITYNPSSCGSMSPVLIADGTGSYTSCGGTGTIVGGINLANYVYNNSSCCSGLGFTSAADVNSFFAANRGTYEVQIFTSNGCVSAEHDVYFALGGCKGAHHSNNLLNGNETANVKVTPNPANNFANIQLMGMNGNASVTLYNIEGQKVMDLVPEQNIQGSAQFKVDLSTLPEGMYFYKTVVDGVLFSSDKLTIMH